MSESEIEFCDKPEDREQRHKFKYYCPVCLRYFTHMLQSACCQNYLCLFCAKDLQKQEALMEAYHANCPYNCTSAGGTTQKFKLADVNPTAQIKRYSDSQCMSFFSNNLAAKADR